MTSPACCAMPSSAGKRRSEEHTSELQSQSNLVCRLLLEKKKKNIDQISTRLNSSHSQISYALLCLQKSNTDETTIMQTLNTTIQLTSPTDDHRHTPECNCVR